MKKITCLTLACLATALTSSAMAGTFTIDNSHSEGFMNIAGFTQKGGTHITGATCGPLKKCSFSWSTDVTYISIQQNYAQGTVSTGVSSDTGFSEEDITCHTTIQEGWYYINPTALTCHIQPWINIASK